MEMGRATEGVRRRAYLADAVMASVFIALMQIEIWVFGDLGLDTSRAVFSSIIASIAGLALLLRSHNPVLGYFINAVALVTLILIGYPSDIYQWTNLILLYAMAARTRGVETWVGLLLGIAAVVAYFTSFPEKGGLLMAALVVMMWIATWLAGRVNGARRHETALRADRDLAAALAETRQERLGLQNQRAEMARELHDLIGHTVNVMVVHAGAGRRAVRKDPDGAERAFQTIEDTGRSALSELDRLLGVLRSDDEHASTAPTPSIDALPDVIDQFDESGLAVSLDVSGSDRSVPPSVGLTAYRIVQEALTNTLKHSAGSRASVQIDIDDHQVALLIEDDGHGGPSRLRAGRGLIGIGERVALHDGTVEYGPMPTGGFRVRCILPAASQR